MNLYKRVKKVSQRILLTIIVVCGLFTGCQSGANIPDTDPPPAKTTTIVNRTIDSSSRSPRPVPFGAAHGMRKHEFPADERMGAMVVYFAKTICPACARQDVVYQDFIRALPAGVKARKVFEYEVDADWYGIEHYPTTVIFVDGLEVWRHEGVCEANLLQSAIDPHTAVVNNWTEQ